MEQNNYNRKWLRTEDVLENLGIGKTTLYRLIEKGDLAPPKKHGKFNIWANEDIQSYWESRPINDIYKNKTSFN